MTGRGGRIGAQHQQLSSGRRPGSRTTRLATSRMQPDTGSSPRRQRARFAHEKELRDEAGGNGAQGGEAQQQAPESLRLTRVLHPLVLRQRHLSLLLQGLHVDRVRQTTGV
ncbi:hypothetical protein EYF80_012733 [Liparis tanakae]|uniref:Uncharacterized protein n=1 Tax=Liparis tanakae TaxID=230148 RepID=A0A4Z2IHD1_9TELE|nr:hypothetical protein EYF80_012733 [Liparis tanakae]